MTDQELSASSDQSDIDTLTHAALNSPDSADASINLRQVDVAPKSSNASYSLGRLEQDLGILQSKWQAVEEDMSERNEQISELQRELEFAHRKTQELEANLVDVTADKDLLAEDRAAVCHEHKLLLKSKEKLEKDLARRINYSTRSNDRLVELESKNVELQVHLQDLQAHIDGRLLDWEKLNGKVQEYENTIQGIGTSLNSHDQVIAEKEEQKAGLALKVMELERKLAELKGRHLERETSQVELQQSLEDQSRELGSLNGETIRLHKDIEKLKKKLERRDATVRTLRQELKDRERDGSSLEGLLSTEKSTISDLQLKLNAANERIADLESRLRVNEKTVSELRDQITSAELRTEEVSNEAAEHEIRAAELQAMLLETDAEKKNIEKDLDAQRELVHVLECEVRNKQNDLDILDRSVNRLSAIGSGIRELDVRIDDQWCEQPKRLSAESNTPFEESQEVLLQPEELISDPEELIEHYIVSEDNGSDEQIRYPLTKKEITIGRSHNSDIRINSKFISRIHARIKIEGSTVTIEDAGSTNGFLVNSEHSVRHTLVHGDKLEIGMNKFRFLDMSTV